MEQNCKNKRSGRKCADYNKIEEQFQEDQKHWEEFKDKESWDKMFLAVQLAVFNCINKRLEKLLPRDEIEGRALDITCTIMQGILNKIEKGKDWKIEKLSSHVYKPCLAIYSESLKFYDQTLGEDAFMITNEDGDYTMMEYEDSFVEKGTGIYHLRGGY